MRWDCEDLHLVETWSSESWTLYTLSVVAGLLNRLVRQAIAAFPIHAVRLDRHRSARERFILLLEPNPSASVRATDGGAGTMSKDGRFALSRRRVVGAVGMGMAASAAGTAFARQSGQPTPNSSNRPPCTTHDQNTRSRHSRRKRNHGRVWPATWIRNPTMARRATAVPAVSLAERR